MAVDSKTLGSFIWGAGGQRLTPEQVTVLRALQARKKSQAVDTSPVGSWTQGAARMADAFADVVQERRLDAQDQKNKTEDDAEFAPLGQYYNGTLTGAPSTVPMSGAGAEVSASSPAPQTASIPQTADAEYVRNGLLARGFSPQVSDGFIANFQDESGLNSGLNERAPIVPGSRGGYGLYQLTGPRRVAYESFAKERGVDPSNVDAQLDFLKYETQGPEAAAAKTFLNAPDTATAAQNIVNNFLRPAPEHRQARAAAYAGLPSVQTAPVAPVEVASLAAPQTATDAIAAASHTQTPYVDPQVTTAYQAPPPPMTAPQNVQQQAPALSPPTTVENAPTVAAPQQMAQAQAPQMPQAPQVQTVPPQVLAQAIQASQSPYASERTKTVANAIIQQQQAAQAAQQKQNQFTYEQQYKAYQDASNPATALDLQIKQAQLKNLTNKTANLVNAGDGNLYDPATQTWIKAPQAEGGGNLFGGNAVDAQAINGLVKRGIITGDQGLALAAGKTVTDPTTGAIQFLTPQAIFGNQQEPTVDLFGNGQQQPAGNGMIQLSGSRAPTEGQANAGGFTDRMINANNALSQLENVGTDKEQAVRGSVPVIGNYLTSPDYQSYDRAKRDFINAQLRRESGAAIGKDEYASADKQYFPQPGDDAKVLRDKAEARRIAIQAMTRSAGPSYQAPEQVVVSDDIRAAREAIRNGADRAKVIERLQNAGIDPTGL